MFVGQLFPLSQVMEWSFKLLVSQMNCSLLSQVIFLIYLVLMLLYLCKAASYWKSMGKGKPCWIHRRAQSHIIWIDLSISEPVIWLVKKNPKKQTPKHYKTTPKNPFKKPHETNNTKKTLSYLKWERNASSISIQYIKKNLS